MPCVQNEVYGEAALVIMKVPQGLACSRSVDNVNQAGCGDSSSSVITSSIPLIQGSSLASPRSGSSIPNTSLSQCNDVYGCTSLYYNNIITMAKLSQVDNTDAPASAAVVVVDDEDEEAIPTSITIYGPFGCDTITAVHSQAQQVSAVKLTPGASKQISFSDLKDFTYKYNNITLVLYSNINVFKINDNNINNNDNIRENTRYCLLPYYDTTEETHADRASIYTQNCVKYNIHVDNNEILYCEIIPQWFSLNKHVFILLFPVQGICGPAFSFNKFINIRLVSGFNVLNEKQDVRQHNNILLLNTSANIYASLNNITVSSNTKTFTTQALFVYYQDCSDDVDVDDGRLFSGNDYGLNNDDVNNINKIEIPNADDKMSTHNCSSLYRSKISTTNIDKGKEVKSWVSVIQDECRGPASNARWGIPRGLGLRGGGESSLNTGTSGWGTPPAGGNAGWGANPQGPPQGQWGSNRPPGQAGAANNQQQGSGDFNNQNKQPGGPNTQQGSNNTTQQPTSQGQNPASQSQPNTSWAQAAGKGLPQSTPNQAIPPSNTTTKQLEQLNTMREALFSLDGWGGQNVNQDTSWDIPGSPEPGSKAEAAAGGAAAGAGNNAGGPAGASGAAGAAAGGGGNGPVWKPNVNNGTDVWEANLRNGGQPPPPQPQSNIPWGHTPTKNIGGTWGEEDEASDSQNVWTGVPQNNPNPNNPWPGNNNNSNNPPNWPAGPDKKPEWGGNGGNGNGGGGGNWSDPRSGLDPREMNMQGGMPDGLMRGMRTGDGGVMRGDPRGVSGRLNGAPEVWAAHQQQQQQQQPQQQPQQQQQPPQQPPQQQQMNKMVAVPPGVNQWSGPMPKDMSVPGNMQQKPTGWEEPSPPSQRRNMSNYDDGTSLWGQQQIRGAMQPGAGMNQNRMPNSSNIKPDSGLWGHPARNGGWDVHDGGPPSAAAAAAAAAAGCWGDEPKGPGGNWTGGEPPLTPPSWPGGPKPGKVPGWGGAAGSGAGEDGMDVAWNHPIQRQVPKPYTKEIIGASKQFRMLTEMNFKKEDVENALRATQLNLQDALEILTSSRGSGGGGGGGDWGARRPEEHPFDQSGAQFGRFNTGQQMPFPPGAPGNNPAAAAAAAGLLNNPNLTPINKLLSQQPPPQQQQQRPGGAGAQPSPQQLRILVNQIQMAVQAGYLNHQILNQPLAPQTLILLNQLLQQIKLLHQLNQQHSLLPVGQLGKNNNPVMQLSVQITKTKQTITNYQNQIAAQQANYVKQQQQQQQLLPQSDPSSDMFKTNLTDSLSTNFTDLTINKEPAATFQSQQQSRLNQWKLPSLDKDGDNEFSRAPGTTSKSILSQSHSSPNINPILGQADTTWSTRSTSDTGWPDAASNDENKDTQWTANPPPSNAFADVIPEFEPGKPWKGTMKNIEDDPSITPGSVARSSLSLTTIKDSELFSSNSKSSPPATSSIDTIPPLSLGNSTWSFNPPSSSSFTSPLGKLNGSKSTWADPPQPTAVAAVATSELWSKARGPPPGLPSKMQPPTSWSGSRGSWGAAQAGWGSAWLLLRNLTPQIDGSTLKTLCLQHGPLQNFHLYLNHGIAFAKYSSREEANKAQTALNNCVLSNTTIFAESPNESDVSTMLNSLGHAQPQPGPQTGSQSWNLTRGQAPKQPASNDTWASTGGSNLWQPNPSSSSLWGSEGESHRTTPSASLNSQHFLPPDLLNGESM